MVVVVPTRNSIAKILSFRDLEIATPKPRAPDPGPLAQLSFLPIDHLIDVVQHSTPATIRYRATKNPCVAFLRGFENFGTCGRSGDQLEENNTGEAKRRPATGNPVAFDSIDPSLFQI